MKKIFVFLICVVMMMSSVCAYASLPSQLTKMPENYSADMKFSLNLENSDEFTDFAVGDDDEEYDMSIFELRTILESLFDIDGNITVKGDISEDCKKVNFYAVCKPNYNLKMNSNLSVVVTPNFEMWVNVDLTDAENPVMEVIVLTPMDSKYIKADVFEMIPDEYRETALTVLNELFSRETMDAYNQTSSALVEKYAEVKKTASGCTVSFDNESLMAMYGEMNNAILGSIAQKAKAYLPEEYAEEMLSGVPDYSDVNILGEDGMVTEYVFSGNDIVSQKINADLNINVSEIYTWMTGMDWYYEDFMLNLDISMDCRMCDYGKTTVQFPELNESNTLDMAEAFSEYYRDYDSYYEEEYPLEFFEINPDAIYNINSVVYVPLRQVIKEVYGDDVTVENVNGNITITSELPYKFTSVTLNEWSTKVYVDGVEYETGEVAILDGTEFVDVNFFENVLGWDIYNVTYDVISGKYEFGGWTNYYDDYVDDEYEYEPHYPWSYVWAESSYLPFIEGQVYLPLRSIIEYAYEDSALIEYNDGKIRIQCSYFPGFEVLEMTEGDTGVYTDGTRRETGKIFTENSVTYVHPALFSEVFGWSLGNIQKNMVDNIYKISYTTYNWY